MPPGIRPQNLNDVFQAAAKQARQKLPELSHNQKVAHLYRNSLRCLLSWAVDRDIFNEEATELRSRFDANRGCSPAAAVRLLQVRTLVAESLIRCVVFNRDLPLSMHQEGEDELFSSMHPDAYCLPIMPGGSKFMRNPPLPMSVCFPDGNLPKDAPRYELNPDFSVARPETGRNATGTVLVDFYKKNME